MKTRGFGFVEPRAGSRALGIDTTTGATLHLPRRNTVDRIWKITPDRDLPGPLRCAKILRCFKENRRHASLLREYFLNEEFCDTQRGLKVTLDPSDV